MSTDDVQTNLRMPAHLKDRLQEAAKISGRTMTAEVVHRLEASFARAPSMRRPETSSEDWERMRVLRNKATSMAAERIELQRVKISMEETAPRDQFNQVQEPARAMLWDVTARLYELENEIRRNDREMDVLYDQLAGVAPGIGRTATE